MSRSIARLDPHVIDILRLINKTQFTAPCIRGGRFRIRVVSCLPGSLQLDNTKMAVLSWSGSAGARQARGVLLTTFQWPHHGLTRTGTLIVEAFANGLPLVAHKTRHVHLLQARKSTSTRVSAQAGSSCMSPRTHQRIARALTWWTASCGLPVSLGLGYCGQGSRK